LLTFLTTLATRTSRTFLTTLTTLATRTSRTFLTTLTTWTSLTSLITLTALATRTSRTTLTSASASASASAIGTALTADASRPSPGTSRAAAGGSLSCSTLGGTAGWTLRRCIRDCLLGSRCLRKLLRQSREGGQAASCNQALGGCVFLVRGGEGNLDHLGKGLSLGRPFGKPFFTVEIAYVKENYVLSDYGKYPAGQLLLGFVAHDRTEPSHKHAFAFGFGEVVFDIAEVAFDYALSGVYR
jgi:hypothetical protein